MIEGLFADPDSAIRVAAGLAGVAAAVSSFEWLTLRREFGTRGAFAWRVSGSRPNLLRRPGLSRALTRLFEPPGVIVLLGLRILSAVLLVAAALADAGLTAPLVGLALTSLALVNRDLYAIDGSDQMILIVALALSVGKLLGAESTAAIFIGAEVAAAYFIAGTAKLRGRDWRAGKAVPLILGTADYGLPSLGARLVERHRLGRLVTWSSVAFEVLFPLALIGPEPVLVGFLAAGLLFHLGTAVTMGLNVFVPAFAATYPCVIYLWHQI
jgi:hypothetical protein